MERYLEIGDEAMWKVHLKIFFKESWKKYGFVFLLVLVQCVDFRNLIQQYNTVNGQEWKLHSIILLEKRLLIFHRTGRCI